MEAITTIKKGTSLKHRFDASPGAADGRGCIVDLSLGDLLAESIREDGFEAIVYLLGGRLIHLVVVELVLLAYSVGIEHLNGRELGGVRGLAKEFVAAHVLFDLGP